MKKQKGISLIVLIITIVVIIILATAIIVNLAQTNIINNAKEATVKQDVKTMQDELTMYIADEYVNTLGEFKAEELDVTDKDEIAKIMPSIKGTKYADYVVIEDGKIAITETMPEPDKTWAMEVLGLVDTTNNTPTEPEETVTPVVAINTIVTTANATITGEGFEYNNPVIPVGFKAKETTNATWTDSDNDGTPDGWNDGLVIADASGNEFVWVPIDGTNVTYAKNFTYPSNYTATASNTSDDTAALPTVNGTTIDETEQIIKYGGFYVGRYESGVPENQTTITGGNSSSNTTGTPVVKQGATVWTYINYTNANINAKSLYTTDYVKSGLLTGTAWDTVCAWIQSETDSEGNVIHNVTNSVSWGNYSDTTGEAQYDTDGTTKISGTKQTAGYSEYWKAKNIYDLAGNTWEWTGETYSSSCIYRGGVYSYGGSSGPVSCRVYYDASGADDSLSFRCMLYVM